MGNTQVSPILAWLRRVLRLKPPKTQARRLSRRFIDNAFYIDQHRGIALEQGAIARDVQRGKSRGVVSLQGGVGCI